MVGIPVSIVFNLLYSSLCFGSKVYFSCNFVTDKKEAPVGFSLLIGGRGHTSLDSDKWKVTIEKVDVAGYFRAEDPTVTVCTLSDTKLIIK